MKRNIIVLIFLISGMAALTYEVVWVRMLSLIFGTTTFAVSTVLFAFMAGLALGSYFFGKIIDSVRSPLRLYAFLEMGIGIYAVFVPYIIEALNTAYVSSFDENIPNFLVYSLIRFAFSMAVLLVPTTLMGGTLPVISRYFVRNLGTVGWDVGILYTINTLGAVAGVLLAGFYLEAAYGVRMSIYMAAVANVMIGFVALYLAAREKTGAGEASVRGNEPEVSAPAGNVSPVNMNVLLWVFAISGFCALGYEVVWFRALLLALHNNTYVFSVMLATFLIGLTFGSYLISRILDQDRNWAVILIYIEIGIGLVAALTIPLFIAYHNASFLEMRPALATSFQSVTLVGFLLSGLMMFVPTLLMGAALPIFNKLYINSMGVVGRKIGSLYAVNTLGAVLGSFVVGFLLIPYIGFIKSGFLLAVLNVAGGVMIAASTRTAVIAGRKTAYILGAALIVLGIGGMVSLGKPSDFHILMMEDTRTLFYKEGASSTVTVVEKKGMRAAFSNGNIVVGSAPGALQTVRLLAHLPLLIHPEPRSAVVIGFGMGVTTHSVSLYPLPVIDVIEIAPEILDGATYFQEINHGVIKDPRLKLVIEDGRNYLLRTRKHYSVITADPTHPILGSGNLYTREYYQQCYRRLSEDGVMVQYVPLHLLGDREFRALIHTFASVFEHSSLWYSHSDLVILGSRKSQVFNYAKWDEKMRLPQINADLKQSNLGTPLSLLGRLLLGEEELRRFTQGADINTDDHPVIEFRGPRSIGVDTRPSNLDNLANYLADTLRYVDLSGVPLNSQQQIRTALEASDRGKPHILKGLAHDYRNNLVLAREEYSMAQGLQPSNSDIADLLRSVEARLRRARGPLN